MEPERTFLKNEVETRGKDKGPLNKVEREEDLGRSRWAHRESKELGTSSFCDFSKMDIKTVLLQESKLHSTSFVWAKKK